MNFAKKDITELFVFIDDFCIAVDKYFVEQSDKKPTRILTMRPSEIITILLLYHQSPCKNFKFFYYSYLLAYKTEFTNLVSYERFVQIKHKVLFYLIALIKWLMQLSKDTGISFIDSTPIEVCSNKRSLRNKVFAGLASTSKSTKGWFHGFKLHVVINNFGEIQGLKITQANVDDRSVLPDIVANLRGLLFGDKGYISDELFKTLYAKGVKLITGIRKNMKNFLMSLFEKNTLKKRSLVETVFDYLKNKMEI